MSNVGSKRERLLNWIRCGDPKDVPVLLGPGLELPASYLGKDEHDVTWEEAIQVAEETGTHNIRMAASPMSFAVLPFMDDIRVEDVWDSLPGGTRRRIREITTPEGVLRELQEFPKDKGAYHREFLVDGEADLPAFAYLIRRTSEEAIKNPAVREWMAETIRTNIREVHWALPTSIWFFIPAVELTSCHYMGQSTAIYLLYDQQDLMEELMDYHWHMTEVWLDIAAGSSVDIYQYAVNGYEWLSPDLYERYMIPQARQINEAASSAGKLSWIHTCGKLRKIAESGMYQQMRVDVVESLATKPTGDISDLSVTRRDIGLEIATRGGINVELFYDDDLKALRQQTEYVLDSTEGFRHMVGDTNPSYPAYQWENIETVIKTVRERGRLYV